VDERERLELYEQKVLPHLDAAYNLARWLAGNDHDAQDVAQEASLRAFRFFGSFRGENARAWLADPSCGILFIPGCAKIARRKTWLKSMMKLWTSKTFRQARNGQPAVCRCRRGAPRHCRIAGGIS
jgi:hypothetical protein